MSFWFMIFLGFLGFLGIMLLGWYLSYAISLRAKALFRSLDKKYESFIKKSIASSMIGREDYQLDIERLLRDSLLVIKPDIEAIIAHINATDMSGVKLIKASRFFKNAANISEEFYEKRSLNKEQPLDQDDIDRFNMAFKDAIIADLTQRKVDLKLGKI